METGTRTESRTVDTGTAIDVDIDPGGPFQLIDIALIFNTAPTTSEDITITTINGDSDVTTEHVEDLAATSLTYYVFRFDKRFADERTIAIDYTNTDARNITTLVQYQLDESVT